MLRDYSPTSTAETTKSHVIVRSKDSDNFTLFNGTSGITGYNAFVKFGNDYYAISSTNSSIMRIETGSDDSGVAIRSLWESRDETWGLPINSKRLNELILDYEGAINPRSVSVDYSRDSGSTFTSILSPDISGVGRKTKRVFTPSVHHPAIRFRLTNSDLGKGVTIYGLHAIAQPLRIRE